MWTFILSRSRRHGLRASQVRIQFQFSFTDNEMAVTLKTDKEEKTFMSPIAESDQLNSALIKLLDCPID